MWGWNGKDFCTGTLYCTVPYVVVAMLSSRRAVVVIEINACTFRRECDAGLRFSKDRLDSQIWILSFKNKKTTGSNSRSSWILYIHDWSRKRSQSAVENLNSYAVLTVTTGSRFSKNYTTSTFLCLPPVFLISIVPTNAIETNHHR